MIVANMNALKTTTGTTTDNFCHLLGYWTPGDNGGGDFYWDTSGGSDNGGTVIAVGSGSWKRLLSDPLNVRWFGARGDGTDDTSYFLSAFQLAVTLKTRIFVPAGKFNIYNNSINLSLFFGIGTIITGNETWELNRSPQTSAAQKIYKEQTYGRYEHATALSATINSGSGQSAQNTQLLVTIPQGLSLYKDRDHAGMYIGAYNYAAEVTTATNTTYTSISVTAPEINASSVLPGMIIDTNHNPKWVGVVSSVSGTTAIVSNWFLHSNTGTPGASGTPSNGVSAVINPNNKIWGANINLFLSNAGDALKGTGIELGISCDKAGAGEEVWGYDCVTLAGKPYAHFISREDRNISFLALGNKGNFGFVSDRQVVGIETRDNTSYGFTSVKDGIRKWSTNPYGQVCRDYVTFRVISATGNITDDDAFLVVTTAGITVTLPTATAKQGRRYQIKALNQFILSGGGSNIDGTSTKTINNGTTTQLISDGTYWIIF